MTFNTSYHALTQMETTIQTCVTQLELMRARTQAAIERERDQLRNLYGDHFCNIIGLDTIANIPIVSAEQLHLDSTQHMYPIPIEVVLPEHLGYHSVVRGVDGYQRPFVAIKVDWYTDQRKKIDQFVEVIFKRYSLNGEGQKGGKHENTYATALRNRTANNQVFSSMLYTAGKNGMSKDEMQYVKDLLDKRLVKTPYMINSYIVMS